MNDPTCPECGQPMFEIGGLGRKIITMSNEYLQVAESIREAKLYQCSEDKTIVID